MNIPASIDALYRALGEAGIFCQRHGNTLVIQNNKGAVEIYQIGPRKFEVEVYGPTPDMLSELTSILSLNKWFGKFDLRQGNKWKHVLTNTAPEVK